MQILPFQIQSAEIDNDSLQVRMAPGGDDFVRDSIILSVIIINWLSSISNSMIPLLPSCQCTCLEFYLSDQRWQRHPTVYVLSVVGRYAESKSRWRCLLLTPISAWTTGGVCGRNPAVPMRSLSNLSQPASTTQRPSVWCVFPGNVSPIYQYRILQTTSVVTWKDGTRSSDKVRTLLLPTNSRRLNEQAATG